MNVGGKIMRVPMHAYGLMQLIPPTAKRYGVSMAEIKHPEKNLNAGLSYFFDLLTDYHGDLSMALAAYNSDIAGAAERAGVDLRKATFDQIYDHLPRDTQAYVFGLLHASQGARSAHLFVISPSGGVMASLYVAA